MGEVFITRKGGGGKAADPTVAVTLVGGSWAEVSITNNDAAPTGATIFVLANYDPNSTTDFDLQASQNGFVFAVAQGATVTQLITGLDPAVTHTVSASAAVIKKLPSGIITETISLNGVGAQPAPSLGPIVSNTTNSANQNTTVISVTNNDTRIPLVIKANFTTSTTAPTTYPFETASLGVGATTNLTLTGLTGNTTYYIHARAFDGNFSSSNVVFGPFTTSPPPLYDFTTWTFTNAGATGRTGPNITQVRSAYSSQSWAQNNAYLSMTTNGIQEWTVPASGSYRIATRGARGGRDVEPGNGAVMEGTFSLTQGSVLRILVGQTGLPTVKLGPAAGGGGGTFVTLSNNTPLIIAGGGGGADGGPPGQDASTGTSGVAGSAGSYPGGTNGSGGTAGPGGSGGGGLTGNGGTGSNGTGGLAFVNGGLGGQVTGSDAQEGGFGGGGASAGGSSGGGGGGGYSGGGGSNGSGNPDAGGGGSFNSGSNQNNFIFSPSTDPYDGYVIITKL